jgi:hypothetical protein
MHHLASLFDWFQSFQSGSFILAAVGIFLSLVASVISAIRENARAEIVPELREGFGDSAAGAPSITQTVTHRLQEVEAELSRQNLVSQSARLTTWGLTLGQYIIGGLLASSFLQEQLPHQFAGFLGVLVLLSTLIYQNFRPDKQMRLAEIKKVRLRALYRTTEDDLQAISDKVPTAPTTDQIRRKLTAELSAIEGIEFEEERPKATKIEDFKENKNKP